MTLSCTAKALCLLSTVLLIAPLFVGDVESASNKKTQVVYNLYFGDLHTHTGYSDAYDDSTPWQAYQAAVDGGADFMAVTDHLSLWHAYDAFVIDEAEWADTLAAADHYTSESFVAMAGYEAWLLANLGELNVYNTREMPAKQTLGYRFDRLPNFYDWIAAQPGVVAQWNHPLYVSDNFMDYAYYTDARDVGIGMIEAFNEDNYEPSYIMALDAGWHVMPTANSDTHYSDWISGHEMRSVLLAESLTPEDLYAAMSASRGYGTLDKNLRIYYTLDGTIMGSTLAEADGTYTASIQISDPDGLVDEITMVEIISDGGEVVASIPTSGASVDLTIELTSEDASYFYVRVYTASPLNGEEAGVTAWTAPVWTGL